MVLIKTRPLLSSQAFFVKDYVMNHPEDGEKIGRLRELMFEQVEGGAQSGFQQRRLLLGS